MAAASSAVAEVLTGAPRAVQVLAAFPAAVYLAHADGIVALVTADGVAHPNALVLTAPATARPLASLHRGQAGTVGAGRVRIGRLEVAVARWFDPVPRLRPTTPAALATDVVAARTHLAARAASVPGDLAGALDAVVDALLGGDVDATVTAGHALVGAGPGLTPAGDDLLAGLFAALATLPPALVPPDPGPVAGAGGGGRQPAPGGRSTSAVRPATDVGALRATLTDVAPRLVARARHATTAISAELLHHAARGEVAAPAAGVLHALTGRRPLAPALDALLAVGATSGSDLAHGLLAGADLAAGAFRPSGCGTAAHPAHLHPPGRIAPVQRAAPPSCAASFVPSAGVA